MGTDLEQRLCEAKARRDWDGYLRLLGGSTELFLDMKKTRADADPDSVWFLTQRDWLRRKYLVVRTRGELPPRRPDLVVTGCTLDWLLDSWPEGVDRLLVNPGTPSQALFRGGRRRREHYRRTAASVPRPDGCPDQLLTLHAGPRQGPLAHGLACGAHLAVHQGVLWNDIGDVYDDYTCDVKGLRDDWGTTDHTTWQRQLTFLLRGQNTSRRVEFVLDVRREAAREHGGPIDEDTWRKRLTAALAESDLAEDWAQRLVSRTLAYEERFRADGLLPEGGFVRTALGYDYGRAVGFARWGVGARYAEPAEAEKAILRAGALCQERYRSWEDFSAGYTLGRVLRFDEDTFGHYYEGALEPHRALTRDPASPWRTIPFR
ncbi:hypothetical protein ACZ90_21285 [Streptomyces albus subsp. albus]|nr:hypothetical protein ACZ90_21285 [Streptomyces albus subsp. albus]